MKFTIFNESCAVWKGGSSLICMISKCIMLKLKTEQFRIKYILKIGRNWGKLFKFMGLIRKSSGLLFS